MSGSHALGGRLAGRVALVTGATTGIGASTAVRLAAEGAVVAVNHRPTEDPAPVLDEISRDGGDGFATVADMRRPEQVSSMVLDVAQRAGRLDFIVSNAAVNPHLRWDETTPDDFDIVSETNLRGTWMVCTEGAKRMIAEGHGGAIVCVSSISAHVGGPEQAAYCASKAGVSMLAKALAGDLGAHSIRINCVEPGPIRTPMSARLGDRPEVLKYYLDRSALHRIGAPAEVASVIAFLLSDDASYVTGASILVDAGFIVNAEL